MTPRLPDLRLRRRYERIVPVVSKFPERTFPQAMTNSADLEAVYRFLSNERVEWQQLLVPEVAQTVARVAQVGSAYAIHDSSNMMMTGEAARGDVGSLTGYGASFLGHFCLAVSMEQTPGPLGLLGIEGALSSRWAAASQARLGGCLRARRQGVAALAAHGRASGEAGARTGLARAPDG